VEWGERKEGEAERCMAETSGDDVFLEMFVYFLYCEVDEMRCYLRGVCFFFPV
jgi:hypothetical protein